MSRSPRGTSGSSFPFWSRPLRNRSSIAFIRNPIITVLPMEYVGLKTVHPTWLTLQLPSEVAELLRFDPNSRQDSRVPGRGLAYLARGPGIARVVSAYAARELLPVEIVRERYLATAHPTEKLLQ